MVTLFAVRYEEHTAHPINHFRTAPEMSEMPETFVRAVRRPPNVITMRGMYRNVSPPFGAQPVRTVCDLQKQVLDVSQHCCYTHECVCVSVSLVEDLFAIND